MKYTVIYKWYGSSVVNISRVQGVDDPGEAIAAVVKDRGTYQDLSLIAIFEGWPQQVENEDDWLDMLRLEGD